MTDKYILRSSIKILDNIKREEMQKRSLRIQNRSHYFKVNKWMKTWEVTIKLREHSLSTQKVKVSREKQR